MKLYEYKLRKETMVDKTPAWKIRGMANFIVFSLTFVSTAIACSSQSIVGTLAHLNVGRAYIGHDLGAVRVSRHLGIAQVSYNFIAEIGSNSGPPRTPEAGCSHRTAATKHALDECTILIVVWIPVNEYEQQMSCVFPFK
jgi:hypothetical protein